MSRVFTASSSEWLAAGSTPVTVVPFAISFFFRPTTVGVAQTMVWIGDVSNAASYFEVGLDATDHLVAHAQVSITSGVAASAGTVTVNTWHHAFAIFASATSRRISLDRGTEANNTTSVTPTGVDVIAFGRRNDSTPTAYYDGHLMWAAIYDVSFADGEYEILSERKCPLYFRRDNLVDFYPLIADEDIDIINRRVLTPNNSPSVSTNNPSRTDGNMYEIPADYWTYGPEKTTHSPRAA